MKKYITVMLILSNLFTQAQNSVVYAANIDNLIFRYNNNEIDIKSISTVTYTGDSTGSFAMLNAKFEYVNNHCEQLLNIWAILKKNKFVLDEKYKDTYSAAVREYNRFHDDNLYLYNVTGTWDEKIISIYKNFLIKDAEYQLLSGILNTLNINGFDIIDKYKDEWLAALTLYYGSR